MNKIIVLTSHFPFRVVGENFFESELEGIAKYFDEVYIIATACTEKEAKQLKKLPPNCKAFSLGVRKFIPTLLLGLFKMPFCKDFYREFSEIKKQNKRFVPSFKRLFFCLSYYLEICSGFKSILNRISISEDDNVVILSYWLHYIASAALKLKEKLKAKNLKVISRAHGSSDIVNIGDVNRFYPFQYYVLKELDGVLAVSDNASDYLKGISPCPQKIKRVYIGSYGGSAFTERSQKPFTVMSCANIIKGKRLDLICDAIKIIKEKIPDICWVHFGDGALREEIEKSSTEISENVIFKGNREHSEVLDYLKSGSASVFVSASASEGLAVSICEAIGYSLPVVATDVGATKEAVEPQTSGVLIPAQTTAEQVAEAILKIYDLPKTEYDKLCKEAYNRWQENLNCHKNSELLARMLMEYIIGGKA